MNIVQLILFIIICLLAIFIVSYRRCKNRTLRRMSQRHSELFDLATKRKENLWKLREEKDKLEDGNRELRTENKELRLENNGLKFELKKRK